MTSAAATSPGTMAAQRSPLVLSAGAWTQVVVVVAAFGWLYHDWFTKQALHSKDKMEDWGHAFVVPLISLYFLWRNRAAVLATPTRTFWPGLMPLALGIVCYAFFIVGVPNHMLQGFAMILTLAGAALLITGPAMFRHLFLPIAYLVFAVTLAEQIMSKATFPLQFLASKGAYLMLKVVGSATDAYFVDVNGNTLEMFYKGKSIPLNVAEACAGMRMVVAFVALAGAVALFACRHWWQRIALLLLAVPVALLMNTFRVAVLGWASLIDPGLASGDAHMVIGTLLLVPGLGLFLAVVWALNKAINEDRRQVAA